jgi:hypothetical protein
MIFAAGDTLLFQRHLRDYQPSDGWSLLYQIRGGVTGDAACQFTSTALGELHEISVANTVTAGWLTGAYVLVGYAVSSTERHQIYYGELRIQPNLGTAKNDAVVTTHYQRMVTILEQQLEQLAQNILVETNIERTQILRVDREKLERQLAVNKELRANEIACENVRNGRPSGNVIQGVGQIVPSGPLWGYPGRPYAINP